MRILAAYAVVVIHVSARHERLVLLDQITTVSHSILGFYGRLVSWAVPMFVMISGSLFLSRDIPIKKIYRKYIFRILTAFLSWSVVYAIAVYYEKRDLSEILPNVIVGRYHLWFLPMIACIYMTLPLLKRIIEVNFLTKYFLVLSMIFAFIMPLSISTISAFSEHYGEAVKELTDNFHTSLASKYLWYFVFGYFMSKAPLTKRKVYMIYALGLLGFIIGIIEPALRNIGIKTLDIRVLFETTAIFVLFKEHCPKNEKLREIFIVLGKYSFGVYLVHEAVIQVLTKLGLDIIAFNPILSVPVISVMVFVISFAISAVLNHIPILKKYIV